MFNKLLILFSFCGILCFLPFNSRGQVVNSSQSSDVNKDSTVLQWVKHLYEAGIVVSEDSIILNEEVKRLLSDEQYRQIIYPATYTWETAKSFIQRQELQKAFWFFINLYLINDKNKELVIKSILIYDKLFKMDKILVSTFYTYSLTDPEVGTIEGGHSKVTAPQAMEKKLNALKEMLFYLDKYKTADKKTDN